MIWFNEPNHGSNPEEWKRITKIWVIIICLTVLKCGLPMLHFCDITVWAKGEDGKVRGMIVERGLQ